MPKQPRLSVEAILAALTVASLGCAKAAPSATAEQAPGAAAPAASIAPAAPPPTAAAPADEAAPTVATTKDTVDAGVEKNKLGGAAPRRATESGAKPKPTGNAACGAGTCSDEMKKGK